MRHVRCAAVIAAAAATLGIAGCGDDKSSKSSGSGGGAEKATGVQAGTGSAKAAAEKAGQAQATAAGDKVTLPAKKAGILQIVGAVESAQRSENAMKQAVQKLGWTSTSCDAQGDPTKMASCGDSLLDRNVDVMFVIGVEPSLIKAQLKKAKAKKVPVIEFSGEVTPDKLWAATYYPDEEGAGKLLADSLVAKLKSAGSSPEVAIHDYPAIWAKARTDQLRADVKSTDIKIAANTVTDAANLVQGTQKTVTDQLTQNPKLKAFWFAFDSAGQAGGPAVAAKFAGKSFPDKPYVVTFHADLGTQDLMRKGAIDEVVDVDYDAAAWIAADQAAEFFARKTPPDKSPAPSYGGFGIFDNAIVTKDNLPPQGQYRKPKNDFVSFFTAKWQQEFGK